jgi:DNA-binding transcriptional ArsR family regulator
MAALEITQSKTSRHLATLRHAGLVTDRREGTWSFYSMRPVNGELERTQLRALRAKLADQAGAAQILDKLHEEMARAGREAPCHGDGACRTARPKHPAEPKRRPRSCGPHERP